MFIMDNALCGRLGQTNSFRSMFRLSPPTQGAPDLNRVASSIMSRGKQTSGRAASACASASRALMRRSAILLTIMVLVTLAELTSLCLMLA